MTEQESIYCQFHQARYVKRMHGVQTGVAYEMTKGYKDTEPKHLRTGINSAMVEHSALVKLLLDKGVFTLLEYYKELADAAEAELAKYESRAPGMKFR